MKVVADKSADGKFLCGNAKNDKFKNHCSLSGLAEAN